MTAGASLASSLAWALPAGVTFDDLPTLPSSGPAPATPDSSTAQTVVDAALAFAAFAAAAAGPLGILAGAGLAAIETLFNGSQASQTDAALLTAITADVQEAIELSTLQNAASAISGFKTSYYDLTLPVLHPYLSGKRPIPPDLSATTDATVNGTWTTFVSTITATGTLLPAIARLQEPDGMTSGVNFQVQGFQTFLAGAGLHLYLLATYVALENGCRTKRPDPAVLARLTDTASSYAAYAVSIVNYINSQFSARYTQVSGVLNSAMSLAPVMTFDSEGLDSPTFINGYSFTDPGSPPVPSAWNSDALDTSGESTYDPNTVYFAGWPTPNAQQAATSALQTYMRWLAAVMVNQYMVSQTMLTVVEKMQAIAASAPSAASPQEV